jgi:hypothetical protein
MKKNWTSPNAQKLHRAYNLTFKRWAPQPFKSDRQAEVFCEQHNKNKGGFWFVVPYRCPLKNALEDANDEASFSGEKTGRDLCVVCRVLHEDMDCKGCCKNCHLYVTALQQFADSLLLRLVRKALTAKQQLLLVGYLLKDRSGS